MEGVVYWAGCNRWVNRGANEYEPIGTATSMHECLSCERVPYCKLKKETDVWEWSEEIENKMSQDWREMLDVHSLH